LTDNVRSEVLLGVQEERNIPQKGGLTGLVTSPRTNCLLKQVIKRRKEGRIEVTEM
jgi:hypothetical protein